MSRPQGLTSGLHTYDFRLLLQAMRRQLLDAVPAGNDRPGFAARPMTIEEEVRQLRDIDAALARIAEGTYGLCMACGGEIGRARLKAGPTAIHCLPCQDLALGSDHLRVKAIGSEASAAA